MKTRKIPQRMCIGCRQMMPKGDLIRVVKAPDGSVSIDEKGKAPGRGAYLCHNVQCLEKAYKAKLLERNLETAISEEVFETLKERIHDGGQ